jgi:uncharacterized protein
MSANASFTGQVGAVLSADIAVPEHERERRFYARVLTTGETPLWREEDLTNNLGMPVIGLGAQTPEYASLPLQWMPHIQVADVAASAKRAVELGGNELMHHRDATGRSGWAVLLDPNGAAFGIIPVVPASAIPAGADAAAGEAAPIGRIAWLDLTIPDAATTRDFYREVVGWSVKDVDMKDGDERYADYAMLAADGSAAGGVCHARGSNAGLPPVWMLYLSVGDVAESLRRVESEGGRIIRAVKGKDGGYFYAAVQDPVGVSFALVPG